MPARKPSTLNNRNDTKADRSARAGAESAMAPKTQLTVKVPIALKGHPCAADAWRDAVGLYLEIDGTIATAFDKPMLIDYCMSMEELNELATMRREIKADWQKAKKAAKKIKLTTETLKEWVQMWSVVSGLEKLFKEYDARMDGKKKLILSYRQSLYLTPRSRAGVAPPEKAPEKPKSDMGGLLDED